MPEAFAFRDLPERPGLATAESLSAFMAYRPDKTHTDANRNLVSNIHPRWLKPQAAADRILSPGGADDGAANQLVQTEGAIAGGSRHHLKFQI